MKMIQYKPNKTTINIVKQREIDIYIMMRYYEYLKLILSNNNTLLMSKRLLFLCSFFRIYKKFSIYFELKYIIK